MGAPLSCELDPGDAENLSRVLSFFRRRYWRSRYLDDVTSIANISYLQAKKTHDSAKGSIVSWAITICRGKVQKFLAKEGRYRRIFLSEDGEVTFEPAYISYGEDTVEARDFFERISAWTIEHCGQDNWERVNKALAILGGGRISGEASREKRRQYRSAARTFKKIRDRFCPNS